MDLKNKSFDDIRRLTQSIEVKQNILLKYLQYFNEDQIKYIKESTNLRERFDKEIKNSNPNLNYYFGEFAEINRILNLYINKLKENNKYISEETQLEVKFTPKGSTSLNYLVDKLSTYLVENIEGKKIACMGGSFKPPHSGHFQVVKEALQKLPNIDQFIIFVGNAVRDGITQEQSMQIWGIYQKYLSDKVKVVPTDKPPIRSIYDYAKENQGIEVNWVLGIRKGQEEDKADYKRRTSAVEKYPNLKTLVINTEDPNISGTNARVALGNKDEFLQFIPNELSNEDKDKVWDILSEKHVDEIKVNNPTQTQFPILVNSDEELHKNLQRLTKNGFKIYNFVIEPGNIKYPTYIYGDINMQLFLSDDDDNGKKYLVKNKSEFLGEIKINNPNFTPEKIWDYINKMDDSLFRSNEDESDFYSKLVYKYGFKRGVQYYMGNSGVEAWLYTLPQEKLNKFYNELKQGLEKVDEIKVNNPIISNDDMMEFLRNFVLSDKITNKGIPYYNMLVKYGYKDNDQMGDFIARLSPSDRINIQNDLNNLKEIKINIPRKFHPGEQVGLYDLGDTYLVTLTKDPNRLYKEIDGEPAYLVDDEKTGQRYYSKEKYLTKITKESTNFADQVVKEFNELIDEIKINDPNITPYKQKAIVLIQKYVDHYPTENNIEWAGKLFKKINNFTNIDDINNFIWNEYFHQEDFNKPEFEEWKNSKSISEIKVNNPTIKHKLIKIIDDALEGKLETKESDGGNLRELSRIFYGRYGRDDTFENWLEKSSDEDKMSFYKDIQHLLKVNEIKINDPSLNFNKAQIVNVKYVGDNNDWLEKDGFYDLIDLGPYYTFIPYHGIDLMLLYPKTHFEDIKFIKKLDSDTIEFLKTLTNKKIIQEDKIPGGLAQGKTIRDIAKHHNVGIIKLRNQLTKGIEVEMEHTNSKSVAREIAMDHLFEDPKYYDKLEKIETNEIKVNNPIISSEKIFNYIMKNNIASRNVNEYIKILSKYNYLKYEGGYVPGFIDQLPISDKVKLYNDLKNYVDSRNIQENKSLSNGDFKKYINYLDRIVKHCCDELQIPRPKINIINNDKYPLEHQSFGGYKPGKNEIDLVIKNRTCSDSGRTLAHELKHADQDHRGVLTPDSGKDGSEHENEANSFSGKIMREFNRKYPEILVLTLKSVNKSYAI